MTRKRGEPFDWQRERSLYLPTARLIPSTEQTGGSFRTLTVDEFIAWVHEHTVVGGPNDKGLRQGEVATRIERFGDIAHAFSTYQKHFYGSTAIVGRGINSIQMVHHDGRWWVTPIAWGEKSGGGPLPAKCLPSDS